MPRVTWPLLGGRPSIQIVLMLAGDQPLEFDLIADTGAGTVSSRFEFILQDSDCQRCGTPPGLSIPLGGAFSGHFPLYRLRIQIPALGIDQDFPVVGVPTVPRGFGGIAAFRFLNRLDFGNFGNPAQFGLER